MASRYPSQTETTNFARLSRLVLDVCSDVLRDVLDTHIPPPGLHAILKSQKHHLRQNLKSHQRSILYPPGNVFSGTLEDLDFSLLCSLVRNIQGINISPHTKGWGKEPDAADRSLAANIDRLRVQRNEAHGHIQRASLSDTDFRRIWGIIRRCISEIEQDTLTGHTYVREVDNLLNVTMDPDTEKELIQRLQEQQVEFETIVEGLEARQDAMETEQKARSARQDTMETEQKTMSARQDTMETEQKTMSARQDTMETEQKTMSARQDTMDTEQKTMSARQDTMETEHKAMEANQESMARDMKEIKEIPPELRPMIETTFNRISTEKDKRFLETKAFHDGQDKLRMNRVLVIKGNTGDGKTSTAFQLLNWLLKEEQCRKPLQLHEIKKLDLLAPNSNLVCIIDDIFGQKDISKSDEGEWNKRLKDVETLFVDKQNQTNILIITIRNEIFNALTEHSLGTVFTEENIVDLSSDKYKIKEEKQELLEMYTPKNFSWKEKEMTKILGCDLHIGFPQCCHLFSKSIELQNKGAEFFENPFQFFKDALSNLPECCAILFLFLNNGEIKVNDLDPNVDKVDKTLLAQAFSIELVESEDQISLGNENKQVDFVRKSLDKLLGFLVRKDKYWSGEEVYRFDHESVHVTLALLYGKKTPVGYIKYPSQTETTNFARLSRLVLDVCSDILRDVLATHIPLPGLHAILKSQKHHLRQKLISRQLSILYPSGNVFPSTLKDLDFSLLYSLVRNIQGINISPHTKGWGKEPDATDRSLAANIDRLRVLRNEAYGHLPKASLSDTDFRRIWDTIRQCVSEIEQDALSGDTYVKEVDKLLNVTMDPDTEKEYIEKLKKQRDEFEAVVEGLTAEQKSMSARQDTMETEQKSMSVRQDTMETEQKSMSARQDTMETEQKSMSARQDTMEIEQKSMTARQDTMDIEQKSMTARLDTVENQQKTMTANQESKTKEIHPDLKPMIETTMNRIRMEKEKKFLETKAFHDAQDKLRMNRVLVIKGNTGDGKTSTAFQLLNWLLEEEQCRKPLQLHEIKDFKLLAPNSNLVCIIDDIFGQKDISKSDEGEWNKRLKDVETLFVDKQNQTNILLITIRNEIFNALTEQSLDTVFTEENIVDLSSDKYQIKEEKQQLLAIYTPKIFSWDEKEITKILGCKLHIGFPQCCHLFCKSVELQKRRTDFFENPIKFFIDALSKLPECSAILFLFLNNGEIKVNDLDPNGDKVNKKLLEQAFRIKLVQCEDRTKREYEEKLDFVRESLDKLLGFLVRKEKVWSEEVYRFDHDSIYLTVALLYGKKTPVGYIKHCPRKALSYLTTVETSTDMVVISPGHYNDLCERLLREIESVERYRYDTVIGSLDVWKESVEIFYKYLNEKKVNKLNILNKACLSGSAEIALYLLKNGVKPDEDTDWWGLITRGRGSGEGDLDILKEIVVYLNDEIKQKLLNEACFSGSSECGMYLLSVGVKPDKYTMLHVVEGGSVDLYNTVRQYGVTPTGTDEDLYNTVRQYGVTPTGRDVVGRNVLHWACVYNRESIVADLCKDYPDLVHGTDVLGRTPLHWAARTGNCSVFQTVEKTVLKCLCRVEDLHHKCEKVDEFLIHRYCVCSHYMCQLVNRVGETVLHQSCWRGQKALCLYICRSYPAMTACRDRDGRHCLHYIARDTRDVDLFIEVENVVSKHLESLHQHHNIKTLLDGEGRSVLDLAKDRTGELRGRRNPLYEHLLGVFSK